jgi:hypothetical protein
MVDSHRNRSNCADKVLWDFAIFWLAIAATCRIADTPTTCSSIRTVLIARQLIAAIGVTAGLIGGKLKLPVERGLRG